MEEKNEPAVCEKEKPNAFADLAGARDNFINEVCRVFKIQQLCDWLAEKFKRG